MQSEKTVITLTDANWGRGETGGYLCERGRMCITGHLLANKFGIQPEAMEGMMTPYDNGNGEIATAADFVPEIHILMDVNDDSDRRASDDSRVSEFNKILGLYDVEVVYNPGTDSRAPKVTSL